MQIALFTYATKPRGSVIHTLELAEALRQLGHQVCVYALDKDGQGFGRSLPFPVQLVPAASVTGDIDALIQQRIQELVEFLQHELPRQSYNIFHAQDCITANALALLRQQQLIPQFCRTVHHIEDYNSSYLRQCQERSIRQADRCFCVSQYWQEQLLQQYQIHAPRVINGVNCDRFNPLPSNRDADLKQELGINGFPVYLTVGGIEPRKNSIQLLRAFAQVLQIYPEAQLVIAGGATLFDYQPYREQFLAEVKQWGIEIGRSLLLPGVIADADLPCLYRNATAFVFPSVKEGWGLVVLEALASGVPPIVSNHAPFTEFLTSDQAGFVQPDDPAAIAQAMVEIVQPDQTKKILQNRYPVLQTYSWKASAQIHEQHYRQLSLLCR